MREKIGRRGRPAYGAAIAIACVSLLFPHARADAAKTRDRPKLVVVIVVDQLGHELFERLAPVYSGGFKIFRDRGIRFTDAHHDHAITQTAPGHFVLMSGKHPGHGGVMANEYYDRTQRRIVYAVNDPDARVISSAAKGVSYRNADATALGDWMKAADARSKVFSVAGKDRSAILLGGQRPDGAFWFDGEAGGFTTSSYYADTTPPFVQAFNAQNNARSYFGRTWERALKDGRLYLSLAGPDDAAGENILADDGDSPVFPHRLGAPPEISEKEAYNRFKSFPWMDELTIQLATRVVTAAGLGKDDAPDLLCVSLSAFDLIGHTFGPNSQESMDVAVRIDRELAVFIRDIERSVGRDRVVMALCSDHGVSALVERLQANGNDSMRASGLVKKFRDRLYNELETKYGDADSLFLFRGQENIHFDHDELAKRKIDRQELYNFVRNLTATEKWIGHVYDRNQLIGSTPLDREGERMRNSFHPDKGADMYFIPKENYLTGGYQSKAGTNHGTPYDYDSRVPLVLIVPGTRAAAVKRFVRVVDLAPTLASLIGAAPPADIDGRALPEATPK